MLFLLLLVAVCLGHGLPERPLGLLWQQWHMKEEHQLDSFDAKLFFLLHDIHGRGVWTLQEVLYVYGLTRDSVVGDGSGGGAHAGEQQISAEAREKVVLLVMRLMDTLGDKTITLDEWLHFVKTGGELPDFGYGVGHHMDFENEYENHHWNEYHRDLDPDVMVKHKEDIEHELLHHLHEIEGTHGRDPNVRAMAQVFSSPIRVENVPKKYLRV